MTVTHAGTTKKYAAGWESIFGNQGGSKKTARARKSAGRKASVTKKSRAVAAGKRTAGKKSAR